MSEVLVKVQNLTNHPKRIGAYTLPPASDQVSRGWGQLSVRAASVKVNSGDRSINIPPESLKIIEQELSGLKKETAGVPGNGTPAAKTAKSVKDTAPSPIKGITRVPADFDGNCYVILSGTDYGRNGQGQTPAEVARALAQMGHQVLYIHAGNWQWDGDYIPHPNLQVLSLIEKFGYAEIKAEMDRSSRRQHPGKVTMAVTSVVGDWSRNAGVFGRGFLINFLPLAFFNEMAYRIRHIHKFDYTYWCIDLWAGFGVYPGTEERDGETFLSEELRLFDGEATSFVATSKALQYYVSRGLQRRRAAGDRLVCTLINNGVDLSQFPEDLDEADDIPPGLVIGERTVVYWGFLGGTWFNWDYVRTAATVLKDYEFNFIGEIPPRSVIPGGDLPPNVHFLGFIPHNQLWRYGSQADVGIIPFKHSPLCDAVDPLKAYEYLACGIPVVTSGTTGISDYPMTLCAETADEFVEFVREAAESPHMAFGDVRKFLEGCTWASRVASYRAIVEAPVVV